MVYSAHYAWLVDFDGPWCTNVNTSAWSDVWWYTLRTMPDLFQQVRHSVQGIPSNVTSGTSVYISTSRSIKVNKSGIVYRVYHQTSLQAKWRLMVYPVHYAWLVDFDGPWCTNVNWSAWSDVWWYTLHTMPDLLTVMDFIVCRVFHETSLQALVFTLVHQGPSKSTSQA
jgi:hypothetical protein